MNEIRRLKGVGKAQLYGSERAMRIWIDPQKLIGFNLTPNDVADAIAAQNAQVAPGSIGDLPGRGTQEITANVVVKGQLGTPEEFAAIVLRANPDGSTVTIGDVARVEIGARIPVRHTPQRQTVHRLQRPALTGRQRHGDRDPGAGQDGRAGTLLPRGRAL